MRRLQLNKLGPDAPTSLNYRVLCDGHGTRGHSERLADAVAYVHNKIEAGHGIRQYEIYDRDANIVHSATVVGRDILLDHKLQGWVEQLRTKLQRATKPSQRQAAREEFAEGFIHLLQSLEDLPIEHKVHAFDLLMRSKKENFIESLTATTLQGKPYKFENYFAGNRNIDDPVQHEFDVVLRLLFGVGITPLLDQLPELLRDKS